MPEPSWERVLSEDDMSGLLERNRQYKERKEKDEPTSGQTEPAGASDVVVNTIRAGLPPVERNPVDFVRLASNPVNTLPLHVDNTPGWVKDGSYEKVAEKIPGLSRAQYGHMVSKYRREQGEPDLSYQEWADILKGQNPYETEEERQKRESRLKRAAIINGVGSVLGNLVNYVRARNGNVAMDLGDGTEGYNRIDRIRQGQEQLGRIYAKDYLGVIAQDRAERAKEAAAAAAAQQRERDYLMKEAELKIKIENARSERERKAAADELARMKFKHQQESDAARLKETQRHNRSMEGASWYRAKNGNKIGEYLELETREGVKRYTPNEHGTNWVHKAYQDMLRQPGGHDFIVRKFYGSNSNTPSDQEMYEAITRFNESQWKNRYKSNRYKGGSGSEEKPPLE